MGGYLYGVICKLKVWIRALKIEKNLNRKYN